MSENKHDDVVDIDPENVIDAEVPLTTSPRAKRANRWLITAAALALSAVAGGWAYRDIFASYFPSDQITALSARVEALENANATLNKKMDALVGFSDEIKSKVEVVQTQATAILELQNASKDTKSKIATLQSSLESAVASVEGLKTQLLELPTAAGGAENPALVLRLQNLENDIAALKTSKTQNTDVSVLSQNLADLKAKIAAGAAYDSEINQIAAMVPAADGLDVLKKYAAAGLPNAANLAVELRNLLPSLVPAQPAQPPSSSSWWDYASSLASGLITIRSSGDIDWNQVVSQAIVLAEQGDLANAVSTLEKPEGSMPIDVQSWHDRAAARLSVEDAVAKTSAAIVRQIAAKG